MKKLIFLLALSFICAILVIGFPSCDNDDDDENKQNIDKKDDLDGDGNLNDDDLDGTENPDDDDTDSCPNLIMDNATHGPYGSSACLGEGEAVVTQLVPLHYPAYLTEITALLSSGEENSSWQWVVYSADDCFDGNDFVEVWSSKPQDPSFLDGWVTYFNVGEFPPIESGFWVVGVRAIKGSPLCFYMDTGSGGESAFYDPTVNAWLPVYFSFHGGGDALIRGASRTRRPHRPEKNKGSIRRCPPCESLN